ncbi:MAG: hypothetical protein MJB14_06335, partial [Spirochaetes bacterium]|nr:hypothetical protein [Spirochaetota bacterium]
DQYNIKHYLGISGRVEDIIEKLISDTLISGESLCKPGNGKGYGVDKSECDHDNETEHQAQGEIL